MDKDCSLEMGHLFRIGLDFTNIFLYVLFSEIFQNLFIQNIKLEDILGVICYHVCKDITPSIQLMMLIFN